MAVWLRGLIASLRTPFNEENKIDFPVLEQSVNFLVRNGAAAIALPMHNGESLNMSPDEIKELIAQAVKFAAGRIPVIAHVSMNGTDLTIELARFSQEAGADAIIVRPPFFWHPPEEALYQHFYAVAASVDIPVFFYNNLSTGVEMSVDLVRRLAENVGNFVGMKDASFNMIYFTDLCRTLSQTKPDVGLYTGVEYLLPSMPLGGSGSWSGLILVTPRLVTRLFAACERGDYAEARELQFKVAELMRAIRGKNKNHFAVGQKAAMEILGRPTGNPRRPLFPLSEAEKAELARKMEALGLLEEEPYGW